MLEPKNPERHSNFQQHGAILSLFYLELCFHHGPDYEIVAKNRSFSLDSQMLIGVRGNQVAIYGCSNPDYTKVGSRASRPHKHVQLVVGVMLAQNPIRKCNQPIAYTSQLLNYAEKNYTTTKKEALAMVYALHKYRHYLLSNKFVFYVDHMTLLYLVKKPKFLVE
jgi:hypothetical protein